MRFLDTNVLLYAISRDPAEARKSAIATALLADRDLALSVQVLQEFYMQATRASRADALSHEVAVGLVDAFARFPVQPVTLDVVQAALRTKDRFSSPIGTAPSSKPRDMRDAASCCRKISDTARITRACGWSTHSWSRSVVHSLLGVGLPPAWLNPERPPRWAEI